ncbi:hypothetical protein [Nonomuraea typhae]|uniref:Class F sortase n=1 Tax=Nonomuraea typhae TaxID=2603600 RepID=A0ABW7Z648_9ACTN
MRAGVPLILLAGAVLVVAGKPGLDKVIEMAGDLLPLAAPEAMARSAPVRMEIPGLKVKAAVTPLGLNDDGTVRVLPARQAHLVSSVETFPKGEFPTGRVYADAGGAQLRLITCGGAFDPVRREYAENVVVFAELAGRTDK